ncbi:unnamed protein product [Orchesella dallaii]|uniref:Uncharacterized protein n=1 Tax=Orchesella dallaii TaxID=48710 RepID=A0ABP1RPS5_9HEXA
MVAFVGSAILVIFLLANAIIARNVRNSFELAVKEQSNGWDMAYQGGKADKVVTNFHIAELLNIGFIFVAIHCHYFSLKWAIYQVKNGRAFEQPIWINGFFRHHAITRLILLMTLLMLIALGVAAPLTATPLCIWIFLGGSYSFSLACLISSLELVIEIKNLEEQSEDWILRERIGNGNV